MAMDISAAIVKGRREWIPFHEGAEVLMEFVGRDQILEIGRQARTVSLDRDNGRIEEIDPLKFDLLLARGCVKGWKGFVVDGVEFAYSPENCDALMSSYTPFANFVTKKVDSLADFREAEQRRMEKNSVDTSGQD